MAAQSADTYDTITYDVDGHTATITLNRPEALNALSPQMINELRDAYDEAENDDDVWILLVTGTGRAFCTGADVTEIPDDGRVVYERAVPVDLRAVGGPQEGTPPFRTMTKPILAAVNGLLRRRARLGHHRRHRHRLRPGEFFDPHVSIGLVSGREMVRLARALPTNDRHAHGADRASTSG